MSRNLIVYKEIQEGKKEQERVRERERMKREEKKKVERGGCKILYKYIEYEKGEAR